MWPKAADLEQALSRVGPSAFVTDGYVKAVKRSTVVSISGEAIPWMVLRDLNLCSEYLENYYQIATPVFDNWNSPEGIFNAVKNHRLSCWP